MPLRGGGALTVQSIRHDVRYITAYLEAVRGDTTGGPAGRAVDNAEEGHSNVSLRLSTVISPMWRVPCAQRFLGQRGLKTDVSEIHSIPQKRPCGYTAVPDVNSVKASLSYTCISNDPTPNDRVDMKWHW
jgi:hypothetical protein